MTTTDPHRDDSRAVMTTTDPHRDDSRADIGLGERGFTVPEKASDASPLGRRLAAELELLDGDDLVELVDMPPRPRTRGECADGERPCPFVSCRHHLAIDVLDTGSLKINNTLDLTALRSTCSLDVADEGAHTLLEVGLALNLTRERVRQLETRGSRAMRAFAKLAGLSGATPFVPDRHASRPTPGRSTE